MKVEREKPCQRRFHRVKAPMKVTLFEGQQIIATDWSIGGLRLDDVSGELPAIGDTLPLVLELPFQGFDISFDVNARVVRTVEDNKTIAFEFVELSERANDLMRHFIDDLIRGKMATVDDTICRIDIPVTPISTKPDPNPGQDMPVSRWPLKTIIMTGVYGFLALAIFGYIGLLVFTNTMRMEVSSAVVSAPLSNIRVPVDGMLLPVRLEEDALVEKGQTIARIVDSDIESKIADKRIELDQARRQLSRAEGRYRIEASLMRLYQIVNRTDREISQAKVNAAREALIAADAQVLRLDTLHKKGLVTATKLGDAVKQQSAVAARLREAELELERDTAMEAVSDRRYFNHKEFVTDLDMIALQVEEVNAKVIALSQQLEKLETKQANMVIRAPFDSRIISVKQVGNVQVFRNQPLLTLEKLEVPTVTAFLDQDQVMNVGLADHAKIFVPALNRHISAQVYKIDRNSAFLDPKASHYTWTDSKEKSAAVSLRLNINVEELSQIRAGLPVTVIFPKRSTNSMLSEVTNWMGSLRKEKDDETAI